MQEVWNDQDSSKSWPPGKIGPSWEKDLSKRSDQEPNGHYGVLSVDSWDEMGSIFTVLRCQYIKSDLGPLNPYVSHILLNLH